MADRPVGFFREGGKKKPRHEKKGVNEKDMSVKETGTGEKIEVSVGHVRNNIMHSKNQNVKFSTLTDGDEYVGMIEGITVEPEIDGKKIPSRLFVVIRDMKEFVGDDWKDKNGNFDGELVMVPEIKYINKEKLESALETVGLGGEKDLSDGAKYESMISYGAYIRLGNDKVGKSQKELKEKLGRDAQSAGTLIGFYLDRNMNAIGTTGWDLLEEFTSGGDAFKKSIDRLS